MISLRVHSNFPTQPPRAGCPTPTLTPAISRSGGGGSRLAHAHEPSQAGRSSLARPPTLAICTTSSRLQVFNFSLNRGRRDVARALALILLISTSLRTSAHPRACAPMRSTLERHCTVAIPHPSQLDDHAHPAIHQRARPHAQREPKPDPCYLLIGPATASGYRLPDTNLDEEEDDRGLEPVRVRARLRFRALSFALRTCGGARAAHTAG